MPYIAATNEKTYRVEAGDDQQQREIAIDGANYAIDWRAIAPLAADAKGQIAVGGVFSLLIDGVSYEIFARRVIKPGEEKDQLYELFLNNQRFEVRVEDEREKLLEGAAGAARVSSEARVRAPMPGLVIGVPFEVGASVERGQTVAVLEAMKMENDLAAPIAGTIKEVKVSKGQTVNQGDVLVVIGGS
jgi:biotin carboxyl carrier protein